MKYKDAIIEQVDKYAQHDKTRFIGYNTVYGSRMYGTLNNIPVDKCIESPIAENLMVGMAIGMALEGYLPVVCFERHDFMLLAIDALVNHVDKLPQISGQQFRLPIIIRAIVGGTRPIDPGPMHKQNYTSGLSWLLKNTPVYEPATYSDIVDSWNGVGWNKIRNEGKKVPERASSGAIVIVERKDMYETEISP